jgi:hypothetical protein
MEVIKKTVKFEQKVVAIRLTAEAAYDEVDRLVANGAERHLFQIQSVPDVAKQGLFVKSGNYGVKIISVTSFGIDFSLSHPDWCSELYTRHLKGSRAGKITGRKCNGMDTPSRVGKIPADIREWIMALEVR